MNESSPIWYLHDVRCLAADGEDVAEARKELGQLLPRGAARRMTHLGTMMARVLWQRPLGDNTTLIYATGFAETLALEAYLASFPTPSPALFQTSIHPAAVQQALVPMKQAVGEFFPITGGTDLASTLLATAELSVTSDTLLCGGEEIGTWLLAEKLSSPHAFAFAALLTPNPAGAQASIRIDPAGVCAAGPVGLVDFWRALADREPLVWARPAGGIYQLSWLP